MNGNKSREAMAELDERVHVLLKSIIQQSYDCSKEDEVSRALWYFLVRVSNTWCSIRTLWQYSPDERLFLVDAGVLLRAMLDACRQAEYLVHNPERMHERAKDYLEYEHVERYLRSKNSSATIPFLLVISNPLQSGPTGRKTFWTSTT